MKHTDEQGLHAVNTGWQLLGELRLSVGPGADHLIGTWLMEILASLNLHQDFLQKIIQSAQQAAAHALKSEPAKVEDEYTHLVVFVQNRRVNAMQTWGFFRIEKTESAAYPMQQPAHSIELYLYLEGA